MEVGTRPSRARVALRRVVALVGQCVRRNLNEVSAGTVPYSQRNRNGIR